MPGPLSLQLRHEGELLRHEAGGVSSKFLEFALGINQGVGRDRRGENLVAAAAADEVGKFLADNYDQVCIAVRRPVPLNQGTEQVDLRDLRVHAPGFRRGGAQVTEHLVQVDESDFYRIPRFVAHDQEIPDCPLH